MLSLFVTLFGLYLPRFLSPTFTLLARSTTRRPMCHIMIPSVPAVVVITMTWVMVSLCHSILKQKENSISPGKEGIVKIKSEVRTPLPADLYSSHFCSLSMNSERDLVTTSIFRDIFMAHREIDETCRFHGGGYSCS